MELCLRSCKDKVGTNNCTQLRAVQELMFFIEFPNQLLKEERVQMRNNSEMRGRLDGFSGLSICSSKDTHQMYIFSYNIYKAYSST